MAFIMAFIPPNINFKFGVCRVFSIVWERGKVGLANIAKGVAETLKIWSFGPNVKYLCISKLSCVDAKAIVPQKR